MYRGVAQLGARDIWDVEAAGSNPVTPTIRSVLIVNGLVNGKNTLFYYSSNLFIIITLKARQAYKQD